VATTEPLTEQEQQALEQMRQAQEQGSTLKELAARLGQDVRHLYELRRRLVRKGAFGPLPRRKTRKPGKAGAFVPASASGRLGARVRWIAAGHVDRSGACRRSSCCALAHRT
jgi:hypothetical protein